MRRLRNILIALFITVCTPLLVWVAFVAALFENNKMRRLEAISCAVCSTDTQCPPGFVCIGGRCVPR
ncbi:hypothetical protein ACFLXC_02030 [Chloroflexota bacterium]